MTGTTFEVPQAWLTPVHLRRELIAAGHSDRALARLLREGTLDRPRRGAYVDGPLYRGLDNMGKHALRTRAVLAQSNASAAASHGSALPWFGCPDFGLDFSAVDIARLDGRAGRAEAGVRQHRGLILPDDIVDVRGVPVMSPTRAVLEFSTGASLEAAVVQVSLLLHRNLTTSIDLEAMRLRMDRWPGSLNTDLVCRLSDGRIESVGEGRFYTFCFKRSIPRPEPQYVVRDAFGQIVARLDFAWPARGKWIEFDGKIKYEKLLKEGERASDVVLREKQRERLVRRITGWECERVVYDDLARPDDLERFVRDFLACPASDSWIDWSRIA